MTIIRFVGFETGDVAEFDAKNANVTNVNSLKTTPGVRSGTYTCRLASAITSTAWGQINFTSPGATCGIKCGLWIAALPSTDPQEIVTGQGAALQFAVRVGSDGRLRVYKGNETTLQATGTKVLAINTQYRIDVKYVNTSNTSKTVTVNVDGATVADIDTTWTETAQNLVNVYFGVGTNYNTATYDFYFDDLTVANDWVPSMLIPNAIAASTNLTGTISTLVEPVDVPAATWLTATSVSAVTDLRVSFPTPAFNLL